MGVNPSLPLSAVSDRAADELVKRAADFRLPPPPPAFSPRSPAVHVGHRVVPAGRRESALVRASGVRKREAMNSRRVVFCLGALLSALLVFSATAPAAKRPPVPTIKSISPLA